MSIFDLPIEEFEKEVRRLLDNIPTDQFIQILKDNGLEVKDINIDSGCETGEINTYVARDWLVDKRRECREKESFEEVQILNLIMNELDNLTKLRFYLRYLAEDLNRVIPPNTKPDYARYLKHLLAKYSEEEV